MARDSASCCWAYLCGISHFEEPSPSIEDYVVSACVLTTSSDLHIPMGASAMVNYINCRSAAWHGH